MTASEPPAKWGANSRVEMTWCDINNSNNIKLLNSNSNNNNNNNEVSPEL